MGSSRINPRILVYSGYLVLCFVINIILGVNGTIVSTNNCASLLISTGNQKSVKFEVLESSNPLSVWNIYKNSSIEYVDVFDGCRLQICFLDKLSNSIRQKCDIIKGQQHVSVGNNGTDMLDGFDGLQQTILGMDCSCQSKSRCAETCENQEIPETDKSLCGKLYIDRNCTDCNFNSTDLHVGRKYSRDTLSLISSILVRENCQVISSATDRLGNTIPRNFYYNTNNSWITEYYHNFAEFECVCGDYLSPPESDPSNLSSDKLEVTLLLLVIVGIILSTLVALLVVQKCLSRYREKKKLYQALNNLDKKYLLRPEDIEIDYGKPLGSGLFGKVYEGIMSKTGERVAVKQIHSSSLDPNYLCSLTREIEVLAIVRPHPNVVRMIGACLTTCLESDVLLVMELCEHQSLEKFLQKNKVDFLNNLLSQQQSQIRGYSRISQVNWANLGYHLNSDMSEDSVGDSPALDLTLLVKLACDIASGMEHLNDMKILHLDLAARNILVDRNLTAKVGDLGLSTQLTESVYYYRTPANVPLSVHSLAPETLRNYKFTLNSDMWAFGVCLWELFSVGQTPFKEFTRESELRSKLEAGYKLQKPEFCPQEIYEVMEQCWNDEPQHRPTFADLKQLFSSY